MVQYKSFEVAEVNLTYSPSYKIADRPKISTSKEAYDLVLAQWDLNKINLLEEFKVLLLNRGNRVLGFINISQGGITGTVADPKLIFVAALKAAASYIILAHNHPSENLKASAEDLRLTKKLVEAGKLLDILVMDHLIITKEGYSSFCDEGLI
ncbi:DNA repair protein [Pedobacter quisquiliarum]|uniref:DNA repair protein n=1 Tax=Pedobacter quisquiliarum TaxID=1834438 RepID=A0A916U781_9SPHI|nr:JAB domain-containing protein [Pedobacter quisquiliarum]GGC63230.1 DNA repair protein [Pedobacter quisquiliarum]